MYTWFRITENAWNNAFSFEKRQESCKGKNPKIYVADLIEWTLDDVEIWEHIAFEEVDEKWIIHSHVWLKHFVKINLKSTPSFMVGLQTPPRGDFYIFDNHNHALYFWYQEYLDGKIPLWLPVIHLDQHTDMRENPSLLKRGRGDLKNYVNYHCNVGNYLKTAQHLNIISEIIQINTEYKLLQYGSFNPIIYGGAERPLSEGQGWFILDIDLDFRHPDMSIAQYQKTIDITRSLIQQASLVTIATSPYFLDQKLAIKLLKDIFE
jgi:hypothetical protein